MQTPQIKDKYTRAEAAAFLGVSVFTLNQWASEGKGPRSIKVGRQCVYRLADLEAFKTSNNSQAPQSAKPQQTPTPLPAGAFIMRLPEVMRTTGLSKSTLYALMRTGEFVPSIALGARAVGWPSHLVQQWLADRMGGTAA